MGDKAGDSGQRMDLGTGISLGDREVGLGSRETEGLKKDKPGAQPSSRSLEALEPPSQARYLLTLATGSK